MPRARVSDPTFSYTVRVSARARRARLEVRVPEGLVVVVPHRFSHTQIAALVMEHQDWIERAFRRVGAPARPTPPRPPTAVRLPALGENWEVCYRHGSGTRSRCSERPGGVLEVSRASDADACEALKRWLTRHARAGLGADLVALAEARGDAVASISVRAQRTRWASCSSGARFSLNRNLVFLPPGLAHFVLLHELCHLREMNHGPRFWALLGAEVPDLERRRRELGAAWRYVPRWAL